MIALLRDTFSLESTALAFTSSCDARSRALDVVLWTSWNCQASPHRQGAKVFLRELRSRLLLPGLPGRHTFTFILFGLLVWFFNVYLFIFGHTARLVGSQLPNQGLNLGPQQWKDRVLTTGPPGNSLLCFKYQNFVFLIFSLTGLGII